jgi:hypothetical protein
MPSSEYFTPQYVKTVVNPGIFHLIRLLDSNRVSSFRNNKFRPIVVFTLIDSNFEDYYTPKLIMSF